MLSMVVTYSNPASISCEASLIVEAALQPYSSSLNATRCVYISVFSIFLCPSNLMTCKMSFVLAYSVVAFQCLKVCRWIWRSLGFPSLCASFMRCLLKLLLMLCGFL